MTAPNSRQLRQKLRRLGLSSSAISAAWPGWWTESADASPAARADLAFSLARSFGVDPRSLIGAAAPSFLWTTGAHFKHLSGESDLERHGLTSFGRTLAGALITATPGDGEPLIGSRAVDLRMAMLRDRPYVGLEDLLTLAWAVRLPVVHLRIFPLERKRMAAMTVGVGDRFAVLLGKDANYPAPIAFYLAHEIGHIVNGDAAGDRLVVDFDSGQRPLGGEDDEERAADDFALELLTGRAVVRVVGQGPYGSSGAELARVAQNSGAELGIEPGMLAQLYGHSTGQWATVNRALPRIYGRARPVWRTVNDLARSELDAARLPSDWANFVEKVLGRMPEDGLA